MTKETKPALEVGTTYTFTTVRGAEKLTGTLKVINKTPKGDWLVFDVNGKEVKTRRAAVQA
jgi:hypothetical protein